MKTGFTLLFFLQLFFLSCEEIQPEEKVADYYFQHEYVNYAWGFSHSGFTITPSGEVFSFNKSTPWAFADNGTISLVNLNKNIAASVKLDTLIHKDDIGKYQKLAFQAMSGKLSEPVARGADIIVPDSADPMNGYREVILSQNGDFDRYNLSAEAAVIAEWLTKFKLH
jgi:hypothetical protein